MNALCQQTSAEALASVEPHLERLEEIVLNAILANGGATCDEVEALTSLSHQTCSARFNALKRAGLIAQTACFRRTRSNRKACVYIVVAQQPELFPAREA